MGINYIIIGDSITYGIGDFENGGWATMFKNHIVNQDDSKVCNNYVHIAGLHPNHKGHKKMVEYMIKVLK